MSRDSLGDRIKGYENIQRNYLTRRMPMIIRIDGKAFHSFTKGFQKPFDMVFMKTMWETTKYLCSNIQGCKVGYTQSDEISLLLNDYESIDSCAWFDKNVQKMVSISASMATLAFNNSFKKIVDEWINEEENCNEKLNDTYNKRTDTALFDSRVFVIPSEEVNNYFVWRQQDATRNSIQMIGQANFAHKQLHGKSCNQIQEMLFQDKAINFNNLPVYQKRGVCILKETYFKQEAQRTRWAVDEDIPIFNQDKGYIEKYI